MLAKRHQKMLLIESLNDDLLDLVEHMVNYIGLCRRETRERLTTQCAWMRDANAHDGRSGHQAAANCHRTIRTAPERIWLQVEIKPTTTASHSRKHTSEAASVLTPWLDRGCVCAG